MRQSGHKPGRFLIRSMPPDVHLGGGSIHDPMKDYQDRAQSVALLRASLEDRIARLLPLVAMGDKVAARSVRAMRKELSAIATK